MNGHAKIAVNLQLEGESRPIVEVEQMALQSASKAIEEAVRNEVALSLESCRLNRQDVIELRKRWEKAAWSASEVTGESPLEGLHQESSGWGPPVGDARPTPWCTLAVDVLDFLALIMKKDDHLTIEVSE